MIEIEDIRPWRRHFLKTCRLYRSAFPPVERHPLKELFTASCKGKAEFLGFTEDGRYLGLAYMIVRGKVAFLLYLAVDGKCRNNGNGSRILQAIRDRYAGKDVVLLIESLSEACVNMEIRIRRRGFYLRNGFHDSGLIQSNCGGEANYDILTTGERFDRESYQYMLDHYPFKSYLEEMKPSPGQAQLP